MRTAGVAIAFGTLFVAPQSTAERMGGDTRLTYATPAEAHKHGMDQLDYYRRLADEPDSRVRLVGDTAVLDEVLAAQNSDMPLIGLVPLMEGADPIREPEEVEMWYEKGLRLIGLAWDDTRYASGAWRGSPHGLTPDGERLLEQMAALNMILDLTHMSEKATLDALERYSGPVVATHTNPRKLVPGERQFSDTQIQLLAERQGVMGIVLFNRFLRPDTRRGDPRDRVTLAHVAAHIDYVCQLLGSAAHVAIGSDFDGGFGVEDVPQGIDSIGDLARLADSLRRYGYDEDDIAAIMGGNWLGVLRRAWEV
nr:putative peptidase [uncultured bacterium]